jgi:hypothetical protein
MEQHHRDNGNRAQAVDVGSIRQSVLAIHGLRCSSPWLSSHPPWKNPAGPHACEGLACSRSRGEVVERQAAVPPACVVVPGAYFYPSQPMRRLETASYSVWRRWDRRQQQRHWLFTRLASQKNPSIHLARHGSVSISGLTLADAVAWHGGRFSIHGRMGMQQP